jgi:hypothetical protein
VPFIEARHKRGSQDGDGRPAQSPLNIFQYRQCCTPRAKKQNAENCIADEMSGFTNIKMPRFKLAIVNSKNKVQQRIENTACVVGGKQRRRFNGDDNQPQDREDPCFEGFVSGGIQARVRPKGWRAARESPRPSSAKHSQKLTARREVARLPPALAVLFDGIVRRLAGDHNVVYVAFAQAGAADADESCFLQ